MLSKVTLNHKTVVFNSFYLKQLLKTYLKSKFLEHRYKFGILLNT
jgi:hypothetical protein